MKINILRKLGKVRK